MIITQQCSCFVLSSIAVCSCVVGMPQIWRFFYQLLLLSSFRCRVCHIPVTRSMNIVCLFATIWLIPLASSQQCLRLCAFNDFFTQYNNQYTIQQVIFSNDRRELLHT